ncbi:MAG: class I SAM-dependent methyltransferase [Anaerolineae bacterium]
MSTKSVYDYPQYFEIAYSFRDIAGEVAAIQRIIERYSQIPVLHILEVGCGTAPHLEELTQRGYHYVGLDRNAKMLAYARRRAQHLNAWVTFVQAEIADFELTEVVDFAMVLLGSLYVRSTPELQSHFDSISHSLNPGGLYLLDWAISFGEPYKTLDRWRQRKNDITVAAEYQTVLADPSQQVIKETLTLQVDHGNVQHTLQEIAYQRVIFPQEFLSLIAHHPDFEFVGWWDGWDLTTSLDDADFVYRPIVVVRRV